MWKRRQSVFWVVTGLIWASSSCSSFVLGIKEGFDFEERMRKTVEVFLERRGLGFGF